MSMIESRDLPDPRYRSPAGRNEYDKSKAEEWVKAGKIPPPPDFSAPTHANYRRHLAEVVELARQSDLDGLRRLQQNIKPESSSRISIVRYLDLCIRALEHAGPRVESQSPSIEEDLAEGSSRAPVPRAFDLGNPNPTKIQTFVYRVVRDTKLSRQIKKLHQDECQICGFAMQLGEGQTYSEAHHVKPLGAPHNGPDIACNIIVLCPNHHALLDFGALQLTRELLSSVRGHQVSDEFLNYHNQEMWLGAGH